MKHKVIIITGQLAALKTTLAKRLAIDCSAILISKDRIKELLSEKIITNTRAENKHLSEATFLLMKDQLVSIEPFVNLVIIEANFKEHEYNQLITDLKRKDVAYKTFYLHGTFEVLYERYLKRLNTLHETHQSMGLISRSKFKASMVYYDKVYKKKDQVEAIDTTLFNESLYQKIRKRL